ncbi:MAG: OmpP1/FadL family transporter [Pseudobdellovibrionaceae bacterium]
MSFKRFLSTSALCAVVGGAALFGATSAQAAGFYIQEQSVSGLGSAFAGSTTSINDASTAYFNPANMTKLDSAQINVGVHALIPYSNLEDTGSTVGATAIGGSDGGNPYSVTPVPNIHIAYPWMDKRLWTGFSVTAPFGLSNNYNDDFFGRFDSTSSDLQVLDFSPTAAFKATNWLSIGGGLDIQHANATLKGAVSPSPLALPEGESKLKGSDTTVGYNIGITLTPMEGTDIGATYRNGVSHELDGRISVSGLTGPLAAGNFNASGSADLDLPDIAAFGIGQDIGDKWRVMANATHFGWSNFKTIAPVRDDGVAVTATPQNYEDTWAFAIGAEYEWNQQWTFRAGYQFDETPTTDGFRTTRTPDGDGGNRIFTRAVLQNKALLHIKPFVIPAQYATF